MSAVIEKFNDTLKAYIDDQCIRANEVIPAYEDSFCLTEGKVIAIYKNLLKEKKDADNGFFDQDELEKLIIDLKADFNGFQETNNIEVPDNLSWKETIENAETCLIYYKKGK